MRIRVIYPFILILILLASCQVRTYVQPTPNAPLLLEKNDFRLSGNLQVSNNGHNGAQFQSSYSPLKNIGIQLNTYFANSVGHTNLYNWNENKFGTKYFEGGLGYYRTFDDFNVSYYLGYGKGSLNQVNSFKEFLGPEIRTLASYGKFEKFYHQLSFWTIAEPWFSLGITFRNDFNIFSEFAYLDYLEEDVGIGNEELFFEASGYNLNLFSFLLSFRFNLSEAGALSMYYGDSVPYSGRNFHERVGHLGLRFTIQLNHNKSILEWAQSKKVRKSNRKKERKEEFLRNRYQ